MVEKREYVYQEDPDIHEESFYTFEGLTAIIIGFLMVGGLIVSVLVFNFTFKQATILAGIMVLVYVLAIFSLFREQFFREIRQREIRTVETRDYRTQVVEKDRPVAMPSKTRYLVVEKPREKLNIPSYDFRGSSETKIYHKKSCRLGKSIKKKNLVSNNDASYFAVRGYKPCKLCHPERVRK